MWSLTSQRVKRISGFRNFDRHPKKTFQQGDLHKPPGGVRVQLDGRQRRDAPRGSVADQRGKHEIKGADSSIQLRRALRA